jgi:hypothetical protein
MSTLSPFHDDDFFNSTNPNEISDAEKSPNGNGSETTEEPTTQARPRSRSRSPSTYSRLDNIHNCWKIILRDRTGPGPDYPERLHLVPLPLRLDRPVRVLDVGSGSGIWAVEMARKCPHAQVVGFEVTEIPLRRGSPQNLRFEVCPSPEKGIEGEWTFVEKYGLFDLIHMRTLTGSTKDWPALLQKAKAAMDYGSVIEIQEGYLTGPVSKDNSFEGTSVQKYFQLLKEAGEKTGIATDIPPRLATLVRDAGFIEVVENRENCPIGAWIDKTLDKPLPGTGEMLNQLGTFAREATIKGAREYGMRTLTKIHGWRKTDATKLIENVIKDLHNPRIHIFYRT